MALMRYSIFVMGLILACPAVALAGSRADLPHGVIVFAALSEPAELWVDGRKGATFEVPKAEGLGAYVGREVSVTAGKHRIGWRGKKAPRWVRDVEVAAGQRIVVVLGSDGLLPVGRIGFPTPNAPGVLKATVKLYSHARGAKVKVNGRVPIALQPISKAAYVEAKIELGAGPTVFEASFDKGPGAKGAFLLEPGQTVSLRVEPNHFEVLLPRPSRISRVFVRDAPHPSLIVCDGIYRGLTSDPYAHKVRFIAAPGKHTLWVVTKSAPPHETTIDVGASQDVVVALDPQGRAKVVARGPRVDFTPQGP